MVKKDFYPISEGGPTIFPRNYKKLHVSLLSPPFCTIHEKNKDIILHENIK